MKAIDFNLPEGIKYNFETGITSFKESRLVILDADAVGLLRAKLINSFGYEKARALYLQFGYQHGFSDFMQMKINYQFDNEMELLAAGPVIHTWEGLVQATPKEIRFNRETGEFFFSGIWTNSYEADQHLQYHQVSAEPVCWSLMGYASGWCTAFFGKPILTIEPVCRGKGDDRCEWLLKPIEEWGDEARPYLDALADFWKGA